MTREIIIFVHGTGAGTRDARNPRWWQPISRFSRAFSKMLGELYCIGKPFRWSGANLETHRRNAGRSLLKRLRTLDAQGRGYHLVGHSHGGSVIWNALVASVNSGGPSLSGLKSWTTVGTPFLTFIPGTTVWQPLLSLGISGAAVGGLAQLAVEGISEHQVIWGESNRWGVIITLTMFVALVIVFAIFLIRALQYFWDFYQCRALAKAEHEAAQQYGGKWLGLWHESDEPIAGLRATLTDPLRLVAPKAGSSASLIKRMFWLWYDFGVVPVTNQWAWKIGMSHAQGADVFGRRMSSAWSAPITLRPGWAPLPTEVAASIAKSADSKAADACAALRTKLRVAGDYAEADEAVASLAAEMTWQELIHTSYFEHSAIGRLIAGHVRDAAVVNSDDNKSDELDQWRRSRPTGSLEHVVCHTLKIALPIARLARMIGITLLMAVAASASYSAWVAPFTERMQIEEISRRTLGPSLFVAEDSSGFAETMVRLIALDKIADIGKLIGSLSGSNQLTVERIAAAAGFLYPDLRSLKFKPPLSSSTSKLDTKPLEELLSKLDVLLQGELKSSVTGRVKLASALLKAGKPVPAEIADRLASSLSGVETKEQHIRRRWDDDSDGPDTETVERVLSPKDLQAIAEAASILYFLGRANDAAELLSIIDRRLEKSDPCNNAAQIAVQVASLGSGELGPLIGRCPADRRGQILFEATIAAQAAGHTSVAKVLFGQIPSDNRKRVYSTQLIYWLSLQLDQGLIDEAVALADLEYLSIDDDVLEVAARFRSAGKADFATQLTNEVVKRLLESGPLPGGDLSAAKILAAENRKPEVLELARELATQAAKTDEIYGRDKLAKYVNAAAVYKLSGHHREAAEQLEHALKSSIVINYKNEEQFEAACTIISVASSVSRDLLIRGINRAMSIIENVPSFEERTNYYLALSKRAAIENELAVARGIAELSSFPDKVLQSYAQILDSYLKKRDVVTWRTWGFSVTPREHFFSVGDFSNRPATGPTC